MGRLDDGVLATRRGQSIESLLVSGYDQFLTSNASPSEVIAAPHVNNSYIEPLVLNDQNCQLDLHNDELLGSIEKSPDNIDAILSATKWGALWTELVVTPFESTVI